MPVVVVVEVDATVEDVPPAVLVTTVEVDVVDIVVDAVVNHV